MVGAEIRQPQLLETIPSSGRECGSTVRARETGVRTPGFCPDSGRGERIINKGRDWESYFLGLTLGPWASQPLGISVSIAIKWGQ